MTKQDYIDMLEGMQSRNLGMRGLTPEQRKALIEAQASVNSIIDSVSDGFEILLSDLRELDNARWGLYNAFSRTEPCDHQIENMREHGLDWDFGAGIWFEVSDDDDTVDE